MSLQDWASIAEIVGGIAVIVSLIYVGLQVNDSTSAIRSSAASDATKTMQSWYLEMGRNRQASDIWMLIYLKNQVSQMVVTTFLMVVKKL